MRKILTIATALCFAAGAARAGGNHDQHGGTAAQPTYNATANNTAVAGAAARSAAAAQSRSTSSAIGQGGNATGGRGYGYGQGGAANSGGQTANYSSNYSARGNTPDVILGSVSGGNPCGLGAGAGGSGPGAGGLLSFMWEGSACQRLEDAKLLYNMGFDAAAKERLCQDTRFSTAFANVGQPCAADIARWQAAGYRPGPRGGWVR